MSDDVVVLGCDIGRYKVKVWGSNYTDSFLSCIGDARELKNERKMSESDSIVVIGGKEKFVGGIAKEEVIHGTQNLLRTKVHEDTKMLTLTAIARTVPIGSKVFVILAQPIENQTIDKMNLRNLILGHHEVSVNGAKKNFEVVRVEVSDEAGAAIWSLDVQDSQYHIFDIGSTTFNFATFKRKSWIDRLSGTEYQGTETLDSYSHLQMARVMANKFFKKVRIQYGRIYLIGGSARQIMPYLHQVGFKEVVIPDNHEFVLAHALYNLGVELRRKESERGVM